MKTRNFSVDFLHSATKLLLLSVIAFCYSTLTPYQTLAGIGSPPPNNLSIQIISINEPTCPYDNGYIELEILTGDPDFTIELEMNNIEVYTSTVSYTGTYIVPNIGPGTYTLKVYDATPDSASHTFKINDITNFPFVPYNSERAFGIDVKTNNQSNVYATGFFSGDIQFLNAFSCAQDEFNVYLVRFDKCGNVIWDLVIGQNTGSCQVTSMSVDNSKASEWVTICGRFWGTITFPGGFQLVNTNTNSQISNAYAARFNKNGDFEWAAKMDGPGNGDVTAKGVTADDNGNIIVMGDFDDSPMYVRNAQGNIVSVLSNLGNTDNYYIMYDHYGDVSFSNSSLLSSVNDDEAGGLNHYYDQSTQCTEVFFTGRKNGNGFLGKRFTLTPPPTITFTQSNEYTVPGLAYIPFPSFYSGHFGKSVDTYENPANGVRTIFFSGKSINQVNSGSEPFLFYSVQPAPSLSPLQLQKGYQYVSLAATEPNGSTDLAVRKSSGELYVGGYTSQSGNFPIYPLPIGGQVNGVNDFFIFKSVILSGTAGVTLPQQWGVPVNSDASHTAVFELGQSVPEFFSVCVDENLPCPGIGQGRAYITGSYNSSLSSNQLAAGISFPITNVVSPYIARLVDDLPQLFGLIKYTDFYNSQDPFPTFELSITPNPAILNTKCCIDCLKDLVARIEISTIEGMNVMSMKDVAFSNGCADINLSSLPSGEYFITVVNGNIKSTGKLIKID